ncbi:phosphate acyltransferase PlsX [Clostridium folliculivorans]|uniref:Phosphate acyltransferase n=1 Tax=Clostridium folliculivorans TaxID=2886038 RepID=A0A9W5Y1F2_9CLOT|nr:phosphate acyltransferase PlsX [Clostridium folliculivorans]GKU24785.1 phosphate acyltransferase [Clostridium folliculivorans]GKU30883.1 phosphate acyltransferase [Clostridium folliculivorans]
MKIAIDGMGGDNSPSAIVEGCVEALKEFEDIEIVITGPEDKLKSELSKYQYDSLKVKIINATEVIGTNEHPVMALRKKKDSSLNKALKLVKDKECDAVISAGSTGAFLAGCTLVVGRIKGIERPALSPIMPGMNGPFVVVDAGANVDCKPQYLKQFAIMGKVYYENVIKVSNPTVALVNIGAEEEKGNELTKETYSLLKDSNLNFVGNIEPRDISNGDVNVVVCDGFVGNTVLKMYEGVASNLLGTIKSEITSSIITKIGALFILPVIKSLKNKFDYKEYGGAPFLGVDGICIKAHGSSDARAFKNAIKQARMFYVNDTLAKLKAELEVNTNDKN